MSADKAQLLGLIGLRALAVHDPFEYRRVADLSIPELDQRIKGLLDSVSDDDCRRLYDQAINVGGQSNADVVLDEVKESSFRKARFEALELAAGEHSAESSNVELGSVKPDSELVNPGAIASYELKQAGLIGATGEEAIPLHVDLQLADLESKGGEEEEFIDALGCVVNDLSDPEVMPGDETSKRSAIWNICKRILETKGKALKAGATQEELWSQARQGAASEWLRLNVKVTSQATSSQPT